MPPVAGPSAFTTKPPVAPVVARPIEGKLTGIVSSASGRWALLCDAHSCRLVRQGQKLGDSQVESIGPDSLKLRSRDQTTVLRLARR